MNLTKELAALERLTAGELQDRYAEVFGETVRSRHRQYLIRRIAWGLQAKAEGGLTERALRRAEELADVTEVRRTPPRPKTATTTTSVATAAVQPTDPRLPPVGTALTRRYRGQTITVTVRADGFEYDGERYRSLSAVAKAITGSHMNGYRFFGLEAKE